MNIKMFQRIGILFLVMFLAIPFYVSAQQGATGAPETAVEEKSPRDEYTEAERPEENYLARFEGIRISEKLIAVAK